MLVFSDYFRGTKVFLKSAHSKNNNSDPKTGKNLGKPYEEYTPAWFVKVQDELTGSLIHKFKHEYWQAKDAADWSKCPQIY